MHSIVVFLGINHTSAKLDYDSIVQLVSVFGPVVCLTVLKVALGLA